MSWLTRYAAALAHLGPRQAVLNLLHRGRRPFRHFGRYARRAGDLAWTGRAATAFLRHAGGARLSDGRFTAVGLTHRVGDPPRWEIDAPLLFLFNLHYFGFLHEQPPSRARDLVLEWIAHQPPGPHRPAWTPYPLSLRLRNWAKWLFSAPPLDGAARARVLASIEGQGDCLADTLEHHLRGNHLLENALTLCFLGECLDGAAPARWRRLGRGVLRSELPEQFLEDGGHFERSPMYHALLTHGLLDLVNVLPDGEPLRGELMRRLPSLLRFLAALRHPDGEIALLNDAAFGIAPPPGELLDYAARLGSEVAAFAEGSFSGTGYHVWRDGGDALFVDAGPIGPAYLSVHGHGDMYSYELSLDGRRVVVDGGTSTYQAGPERDWVRSTRAHNTVELAGADQCEFFGAFRVGRRGRPRGVTAESTAEGLHVAGWHDGYRRLSGRPLHHRELRWKAAPRALFVWDTVESRSACSAVSRVRLAPGTRVGLLSPLEAAVELEGQELTLRAFGGALKVEEGFYAPHFGERLRCAVLALHKGESPEFGYALAPRDVPVAIDPAAATVAGRHVARRARRAGAGP
jgi:uncharacterized heparinase superfamily protein